MLSDMTLFAFREEKKPLFVREWLQKRSVQLELFEECLDLLTVKLESGLPLGNLKQFNQCASDESFSLLFRILRPWFFDDFW